MSLAVLFASTIIGMSPIGTSAIATAASLPGERAGLDVGAVSARPFGRDGSAAAPGQATDPLAAVAATPTAGPPRLIVRGSNIYTPDGVLLRVRGWNWGAKNSAQPQDAADNVKQGATFVRVPLSWYYGSQGVSDCGGQQDSYDPNAPGFIHPASLRALDQQVKWAGAAHLWVDVMVRGGDCDFWTNKKIVPRFIQMWQFLANHYKETVYIASYSLLSEPHPPAGYGNDPVRTFYKNVIAAVRSIDNVTPVIIGPAKDYDVRNLDQIYIPGLENVIYTSNFYELPAYVKQAKRTRAETGYPGYYQDQGSKKDSCNYPGRGQVVFMNKTWLGGLLSCATSFREANNVPVFIDQIGLRSETPHSIIYVRNVLDLFQEDELGFTYWTYRQPYTHGSLLDGGAGVLWQDATGVYHTKTLWLSVITSFFQGS
jgi:hypothetical protein